MSVAALIPGRMEFNCICSIQCRLLPEDLVVAKPAYATMTLRLSDDMSIVA
jgi:hypothetical protein